MRCGDCTNPRERDTHTQRYGQRTNGDSSVDDNDSYNRCACEHIDNILQLMDTAADLDSKSAEGIMEFKSNCLSAVRSCPFFGPLASAK